MIGKAIIDEKIIVNTWKVSNKESTYLMYLDANYVKWITFNKLPVNGFELIKIKFKFDEGFVKKKAEERCRIFSWI